MRAALISTACVLAIAASGCRTRAAGDDTKTVLHTNESWCPDGFEPGPSDTCFAIPEHPTKDTPVVVYLHGMYQGHGSPAEWETVRAATERGFAVVVPRGKRGLCAWRAEVRDHYCWPQDPEDVDAMKRVVASWDRVLWQVDALLEGGTHKRYVLAFSNGGFFASFIATNGLFAGQGYAIVNGGGLGQPGGAKPAPMLLVSAEGDPDQGPRMKSLHEGLTKSGWPHAYCPRPGGHAITVDDVDLALRFFKRDAEGTLKPQGTAYACEVPAPATGPRK